MLRLVLFVIQSVDGFFCPQFPAKISITDKLKNQETGNRKWPLHHKTTCRVFLSIHTFLPHTLICGAQYWILLECAHLEHPIRTDHARSIVFPQEFRCYIIMALNTHSNISAGWNVEMFLFKRN